jgi:hypothetical protein
MQSIANWNKVILDLCGGEGHWSKPYVLAGYDVRLLTLPDNDVRTYIPPKEVYGVLAAPPCDHFASSGARWWETKGNLALLEGLSVVDACLRIIHITQPKFWCLENPIGRLTHYLGKPVMMFNPCDYGDPWTKKTCLWGNFNQPEKNPVEPTEGSKIHRMSSSWKAQRSATPPGFAKAFYEANR